MASKKNELHPSCFSPQLHCHFFLEAGRGYQNGHRGGQADTADLGHTDMNKEQKVHFRESGWKGTSQEAYRAAVHLLFSLYPLKHIPSPVCAFLRVFFTFSVSFIN